MRTLVIIPCGKQKIWDRQPWRGAVMARDAYTSSLFRLSRRYAERSGDRWVIVSAKYGLLNPTDLVPGPYNVSFLNQATHPVCTETLQSQYRELGLDQYERCIALGGKEYRARLRAAIPSDRLEFPFAGLSLGYTMQALKRAVDPA